VTPLPGAAERKGGGVKVGELAGKTYENKVARGRSVSSAPPLDLRGKGFPKELAKKCVGGGRL